MTPTALTVRAHPLTLCRGFCHRPWTERKTTEAPSKPAQSHCLNKRQFALELMDPVPPKPLLTHSSLFLTTAASRIHGKFKGEIPKSFLQTGL